MRTLPLLLVAAAALGSCTTASPEELAAQAGRDQAKLASLTAGKVAGAPMSCLPSYRSNHMTVVNENVIAFRDGQKRVYINHMQGGCMGLAAGRNALVTQTTGSSLCRGDIAQVLDTASRMNIGSCVFGDFVPYTRVGP
jgi:hypothetical protein